MSTTQVKIPNDLAKKITKFSDNIENYIIEAIQYRMHIEKSQLTLEKQYKLAAKENKTIVKDFSSIDNLNWTDDY
ncbi:MAG: hypothetical protein IPN93_00440 [Bacteroidetes bacterium]|jgi:hypothetical protein|nr:hypothetical protein [Bacteroidota bacterium]MBK7505564.1 hypothetical protein [Bacteroidota bacterium]MBK7640166.1 hypothetical protein [Bacteroidota bacterium]MBK8671494.1 hypothetical protein [Bacteroidota bacterium]MBK9353068.1 hypothetical protein [Bacteroidota bacterium]